MNEDKINAAHRAHAGAYDRDWAGAETHWAVCVQAGTCTGPFPGLAPYRLPVNLSMTQAVAYAARYYGLGKRAVKTALDQAIQTGTLVSARTKSFAVGVGDGRHSASGFQAAHKITYGLYRREDIDAIVSDL